MSTNAYKFVYSSTNVAKKEVLPPPILKLSSEFRTPIWTFVGSSDKKNIRLVCKVLKNEIDTKLGFPVNLDERKFQDLNVSMTLPSSTSKLRVWGSQLTQSYVNRLLLNSRLVTAVSFSGPTDLVNFTKVLTRCPNLISVTVTDRCILEDKLNIPLNLRSIQVLNLGTEGYISDYHPNITPNSTPWRTYGVILSQLNLPCLRILNVEYTTSAGSPLLKEIINGILKYLIAHKTVKDLALRLHKGINIVNQIDMEGEIELGFTKAHLVPVKLNKLILDLHEDAFGVSDILLPNQDSLQFYDCWIGKRDWDYFNQIIKRNARTLKTVRIRRLKPTTHTRIDLSAFEKCRKLEELLLTRFGDVTKEICFTVSTTTESSFLDTTSSMLPEMIKFKDLPPSLKNLHIQGITVKTEDLSWIPIRLKNLQLLELQMLGYRGPRERFTVDSEIPRDVSRHGLGVTPDILKEIFTKLRKLDTLFVEEFYNNRTGIKNLGFQKAVNSINLIPGDYLLKVQKYFGILIDSKEPFYLSHIPRAERNDLWDIRFNQFRYQQWIKEKLDEDSMTKN